MTNPEILKIQWPAVEAWLRHLADHERFDTIVGVARAGLPLAVGLSFLRPEASLSILSRRGPRGEKLPRYDFETDRATRTELLLQSFELTSLPDWAFEILILDDVATFGDTLHVASLKVLERIPKARIAFACFAADEIRLSSAHPEVLERLQSQIAIDNQKTWVSFPWNLDP